MAASICAAQSFSAIGAAGKVQLDPRPSLRIPNATPLSGLHDGCDRGARTGYWSEYRSFHGSQRRFAAAHSVSRGGSVVLDFIRAAAWALRERTLPLGPRLPGIPEPTPVI